MAVNSIPLLTIPTLHSDDQDTWSVPEATLDLQQTTQLWHFYITLKMRSCHLQPILNKSCSKLLQKSLQYLRIRKAKDSEVRLLNAKVVFDRLVVRIGLVSVEASNLTWQSKEVKIGEVKVT